MPWDSALKAASHVVARISTDGETIVFGDFIVAQLKQDNLIQSVDILAYTFFSLSAAQGSRYHAAYMSS